MNECQMSRYTSETLNFLPDCSQTAFIGMEHIIGRNYLYTMLLGAFCLSNVVSANFTPHRSGAFRPRAKRQQPLYSTFCLFKNLYTAWAVLLYTAWAVLSSPATENVGQIGRPQRCIAVAGAGRVAGMLLTCGGGKIRTHHVTQTKCSPRQHGV